ncbi:hypothetical protein FGW37_12190 [Streptomyces rectiverticillatus]|uniref:hypothetical protein n=1 Tax=Streptomyces rectiverticillatus TaxID=173860 RepID=UPI0015C31F62|nr:hypothetical protein [Streptomyces rectiverticillatus]QLE72258.1 hypothetical protein FGW37_12190 [Streptomyces rectiverticillatus]
MTAEYFSLEIETIDFRDGVAYYEFVDTAPTRQVTQVGEEWLTSRRDFHPAVGLLLTDQNLQPGEFDEEDRITAEEFEEVWERAVTQEGG